MSFTVGWLSLVSWATVTNHRLSGLNNHLVFLTVVEAAKSKIKVPAR